jgi:hypothetical protein
MISEISDFNPNVFFETGLALGFGRKVHFITEKKLGDWEKFNPIYTVYKNTEDLCDNLIKKILPEWNLEKNKGIVTI